MFMVKKTIRKTYKALWTIINRPIFAMSFPVQNPETARALMAAARAPRQQTRPEPWLFAEAWGSPTGNGTQNGDNSINGDNLLLVGGWFTPLKNMSQLGWLDTQY